MGVEMFPNKRCTKQHEIGRPDWIEELHFARFGWQACFLVFSGKKHHAWKKYAVQ